jgi:hypothetical protein
MRKEYSVPTTSIIEIDSKSLLPASEPLKYTDKEADKGYDVLSNKKQYWDHTWE